MRAIQLIDALNHTQALLAFVQDRHQQYGLSLVSLLNVALFIESVIRVGIHDVEYLFVGGDKSWEPDVDGALFDLVGLTRRNRPKLIFQVIEHEYICFVALQALGDFIAHFVKDIAENKT